MWGGLLTSLFIIAVCTLYLLLPGHGSINRAGCVALITVAGVLTVVIALLPWRRIVERRQGNMTIYLWAIAMIGVLDLAIAFTGGGKSQLYLILIVAAVYLAGPAYPVPVEIGICALTIGSYILTLHLTVWGVTPGDLVLRMGMVAAAALAVGFLNHELGRAFAQQVAEHEASENRVALWSGMAAVAREIDAPDVDRVLGAVVSAIGALGFEASDICTLDPDGSTYRVLHARNLDETYTETHHRADAGMVGAVLAQRRTVVVDDYPAMDGAEPTLCNDGFVTAVAGPVWVDGELAAILEAATRTRRSLSNEEISAFEMLAAQAGRALENAQLLERQRRDRDHFRGLLESSPDAVVVADAAHGRIVELSNQAEALFGYTAEELVGQPARILMPERLQDEQMALIDAWVDGEGEDTIGVDRTVLGRRKDGTELPVEISFSTIDTPQGLMVSAAIRDVTERLEYERRLAHQATHDRLTGLPNRELFLQRLTRSLHSRLSVDPPITVAFLDIDHFKYLNDSRGHKVGDLLVVAVADRLEQLMEGDVVARTGGDEFGFLVEGHASMQEAEVLGERLLSAFAEPFNVDNIDCYVTASIGIALGNSTDRADVVMGRADAAVNRAKQNGRSRYELFDETLTAQAAERIATEAQLHLALDGGQFRLAYQPVVSLDDDHLVGMEALIRWNHPVRGAVRPDEFIRTAEDTGLIVPIGSWVLHEACRQLAEWRQRYGARSDISVSVNVSSRQLEHDHFINDVAAVLAETRIPPELLVLEITESFFIRDFEAAVRRLHALKEFGIRLAIDDFGTGFSSLFSLSGLPVDVVKIDKAFIDGLGTRYDAVVTAVVHLGDAFGLDVVAEGIEHQEQKDQLVALGCRYAQGYLFSRPLEVADAELLLAGPSTNGSKAAPPPASPPTPEAPAHADRPTERPGALA